MSRRYYAEEAEPEPEYSVSTCTPTVFVPFRGEGRVPRKAYVRTADGEETNFHLQVFFRGVPVLSCNVPEFSNQISGEGRLTYFGPVKDGERFTVDCNVTQQHIMRVKVEKRRECDGARTRLGFEALYERGRYGPYSVDGTYEEGAFHVIVQILQVPG